MLYVHGEATEESNLKKAGIERARGLMTALGTDPENVFLLLTAKRFNPDLYVVARASQNSTKNTLYAAGADVVVSPYYIGARRMAHAVLRPTVIQFLELAFADDTRSGEGFARIPVHLREEVIARVGNLVQNVAPLFLLCERRDIGISERLLDPYTGHPTLYIYDMYPGGTGLAEGFSTMAKEILAACAELVAACPCAKGCPSCIGPEDSGLSSDDNRKLAVTGFLQFLD